MELAGGRSVCFTEEHVKALELIMAAAIERGATEMEVATDFGVVLAIWTQRTGTAPSPEELRIRAKAEVGRAAGIARRAGIDEDEIQEEASQ